MISKHSTLSEYWEGLDTEKQFKAIKVYDNLCDWIKTKIEAREEVPDILIDKKIVESLDEMKDVHLIPESMSAMMYLAFVDRPLHNSGLAERFSVRLVDNDAVIQLYKECMYYRNQLDQKGYDGPPRTIWEHNHSLDSAESRYEFARYTLSYRGFI